MPEPKTPSDSGDESDGEQFVFMDSVQAIISSINPFGHGATLNQMQAEVQPRAALSEQHQELAPAADPTEPVVPVQSEDAIESRLRQNKALFESLAKPDMPPSIAGYSDKTPRRKGKGVAQLAANFEQRAGRAASASSSHSEISITASRATPLQGYKGPTPQLTSALVFDASRVGTPQLLQQPATPTSMPPDDSSRGSIAAPGTPLSIPPEEDENGLDFGLQAPTQSRMPSSILPETLGFQEIRLAELKPSTELQTCSVRLHHYSCDTITLAIISVLTENIYDAGAGERRKGKSTIAGSHVARHSTAFDPAGHVESGKRGSSKFRTHTRHQCRWWFPWIGWLHGQDTKDNDAGGGCSWAAYPTFCRAIHPATGNATIGGGRGHPSAGHTHV